MPDVTHDPFQRPRQPSPQQWPPPQAQWGPPSAHRYPAGGGMPPRWSPPPPPPRKSGGLGKFLFLLFAAAAAVFLFAAFSRGLGEGLLDKLPGGTAESSTASSAADPADEAPDNNVDGDDSRSGLPDVQWPALPGPTSSDPSWVTLQQSPLYTVELPGLTGCPPPQRARSITDLEEQGEGQLECIQRAWRPVLTQLGLPDHEIPVYYYSGDSVDTQCGHVSAPALYCSFGGGAIYIGEGTLNGSAWHDFAVKDMTGHEYVHHLQAISGMFEAEYRLNQGNEGIRRSELQATCGGFAMIANDDSFTMTPEIYDTFEPFLRAVIEDGIHGSKDSVAYWGLRGLHSTDLGNCNTWTSPSEDVD